MSICLLSERTEAVASMADPEICVVDMDKANVALAQNSPKRQMEIFHLRRSASAKKAMVYSIMMNNSIDS